MLVYRKFLTFSDKFAFNAHQIVQESVVAKGFFKSFVSE